MNPKFQELAFDVVLPSHLLINPNLEPNAKLLYGLVRNLTKVEGYCYARNKYLAELMEVTPRSIQNWLEALENEGYIDREMEETEFNPVRKIFISDRFKKSLQCEKNDTGGGKKCLGGTKKTSHIDKEDILKEDIETIVCTPSPVGSEVAQKIVKKKSDGKEVAIDQSMLFKRAIELKKDWSTQEILESWIILSSCKGVVNDWFKFIEGTINKLRNKKYLQRNESKRVTPKPKEKHECRTSEKTNPLLSPDFMMQAFQKAGLQVPKYQKS